MKILAGDIGGTKTLLRIAEFSAGEKRGHVLCEQRYISADYVDLLPMLGEFLADANAAYGSLDAACFGVAGPVREAPDGQSVQVTNLPWRLDTGSLVNTTGIARIRLINDFQAVGYGIEALIDSDLETLQQGLVQPNAPRLVIGPGTGLGMGILVKQGDHYEALPSEGGHIDFAATGALQQELLDYAMQHVGRVTCEYLISGPGLERIYHFLCEKNPAATAPALEQAGEDLAAMISTLALSGEDVRAGQALRLFTSLCGAYAGNIALIALPYSGVYLAGGIAPKIIDALQSGAFVQAFNDKGRMAGLLSTMPVRVVINSKVGLMGAALAATRL